jgi:hypothetical protein
MLHLFLFVLKSISKLSNWSNVPVTTPFIITYDPILLPINLYPFEHSRPLYEQLKLLSNTPQDAINHVDPAHYGVAAITLSRLTLGTNVAPNDPTQHGLTIFYKITPSDAQIAAYSTGTLTTAPPSP